MNGNGCDLKLSLFLAGGGGGLNLYLFLVGNGGGLNLCLFLAGDGGGLNLYLAGGGATWLQTRRGSDSGGGLYSRRVWWMKMGGCNVQSI
uniref:Uncharacterized protein n=1 Tax=Cucumis sativus TaxID=3659 RepID=A0A0A0KGF0_CUCSA